MAPSTDDPAFRELARELYWVPDGATRGLMDVAEVRDRLHDLWGQMRSDERAVIPVGETNLGSPTRWRRRLKYLLWRLLRPVSWRYDRLIGDHAELTTALADRVLALEAEVRRLEAQLAERGDETP
jgi:hypothetical protein